MSQPDYLIIDRVVGPKTHGYQRNCQNLQTYAPTESKWFRIPQVAFLPASITCTFLKDSGIQIPGCVMASMMPCGNRARNTTRSVCKPHAKTKNVRLQSFPNP